MEKEQEKKVKERVSLVMDLAKAFERACGLGLGNTLQFAKEDLASSVRSFRAPEACTVRRVCGRAAHNHYCYLARVQVELFASMYCTAGCVE